MLWSTTVALSRSLTEQLGILTAAALIYGLGGVLGCSYLAATGKLVATVKSADRRYLLGCGALFVLYLTCLYAALGLAENRSQVLEVGLMNYLWPMLTLVLSIPLLHTRPTLGLIPGVIVAMTGITLATMQNQPLVWTSLLANLTHNSAPYVLGGSAALAWGLYSTLSRRWAGGSQSNGVALFMLSTGIVLGIARVFVTETTQWSTRSMLEVLWLALASNLAYLFWDRAMRNGDLVLVAASSYFTPLLSTLVSSVYLGVVPGAKLWIGCGLVSVGAVLCKLALKDPTES